MYMVYWSTYENGLPQTHAREFPSSGMADSLGFMETQRIRQRSGENIRFIALCSENPDSVGSPGVADPGPDYSWKKRRR